MHLSKGSKNLLYDIGFYQSIITSVRDSNYFNVCGLIRNKTDLGHVLENNSFRTQAKAFRLTCS